MKLLNRTSFRYMILSVPITLVAMFILYFLIRHFNQKHVDELLKSEHKIIIQKSQRIHNYYIEDELSDELFVSQIPKDSVLKESYSTVMVFDTIEDQDEPYRQLETTQLIASKNYHLTIRKSLVENTTLFYSITIVVFAMIIILALSFILLNRLLAERIWSPFHQIISSLGEYQIGNEFKKNKNLKIDEFRSLDESLFTMTQRINKDYFIQKEFIDIISHEYQTPLSIINNEAEMLLQNENLTENDVQKISTIIEFVGRLAKMNKSLLLLSRIDNKQFEHSVKISLKEKLEKIINEKKEQLELKGIKLSLDVDSDLEVEINPTLATILVSNLLQNAIRYNLKSKGEIEIKTIKNALYIRNKSENERINQELLFKKFNKNHQNNQSIGLGLSIVSAICNYYGFRISYSFDDLKNEHSFCVEF
jgi:signal transduction histidine kinase